MPFFVSACESKRTMSSTTQPHIKPHPKMKVGDILSLRVESLAPNGRGVALANGRSIFVREGIPGDQVSAELIRVRRDQFEAKVIRVESPSPDRVEPRCPHFGPCGGCELQHLAYPAQVDWKSRVLRNILQTEGGLRTVPPFDVVPMDDPWAYRSKMEFSFGQLGERITLGLHERGSFQRIEDVKTCFIAPPKVSALLQAVKEIANKFELKAYNPKIHEGFWRYAVIRSSRHTSDLMLLIVTNDGPSEPIEALVKELPIRLPELKSFYWGVSTRVSDVAQPERTALVYGSEVLEDEIGEILFQIKPTNFVQPNLILASRIYEAIRASVALSGREVVYDLYSGIGLIALSMARRAAAVYGVESEPENVALAERNAVLNNIGNATFLCGKVEDLLKGRALFKVGPKPDLIVVDPPRAGLHKEVYAPLLEAKSPALVYLSCNPLSMARDLKILLSRDPSYSVASICMFDFFPHTAHMEVLVTLRRQA